MRRDDRASTGTGVRAIARTRFYDRMRESIRRYLDEEGRAGRQDRRVPAARPGRVRAAVAARERPPRRARRTRCCSAAASRTTSSRSTSCPRRSSGRSGTSTISSSRVYLLNKMLTDTDAEILREHWSGSDDVLADDPEGAQRGGQPGREATCWAGSRRCGEVGRSFAESLKLAWRPADLGSRRITLTQRPAPATSHLRDHAQSRPFSRAFLVSFGGYLWTTVVRQWYKQASETRKA